ncbi:MAG: hypothetical protein Q8N84_01855 [bacterium]|nr:hypothetical protein [bacterium]
MMAKEEFRGLSFERDESGLRIYPDTYPSYYRAAMAGVDRARIMFAPDGSCVAEVLGFGRYGPFSLAEAKSVMEELFTLTGETSLVSSMKSPEFHLYVYPAECGSYEDAVAKGARRAMIIDIEDGSWVVQLNGFTTTCHPDEDSARTYVLRKFQLRAVSVK